MDYSYIGDLVIIEISKNFELKDDKIYYNCGKALKVMKRKKYLTSNAYI